MATGVIKGPVLVSEIKLGGMGFTSGQTQLTKTFTYSEPTGYKRFLVSPHFANTTANGYTTLRQFLYTIDDDAKTITLTVNRDSGGAMSPSVFITAIDIPI